MRLRQAASKRTKRTQEGSECLQKLQVSCPCDRCICMCAHMLAHVSTGLCMPWYTCGGQKTTTRASPHPPPCLRQGLLLFSTGSARLAGQQASGVFYPTSHFVARSLGDYRCVLTTSGFCTGSGDLNSGPRAREANTSSTEPSPQP